MFYFFNTILKQIIKLHVGQTEYYYSALVVWLYLFTALCVLRVTRRVNCRYRIWLTRLTKHLKIVDKTVAGQSILFPSICERIGEIFLMASFVCTNPQMVVLLAGKILYSTAVLIKIVYYHANYFFVHFYELALPTLFPLYCQCVCTCTFPKTKSKEKGISVVERVGRRCVVFFLAKEVRGLTVLPDRAPYR
jgi:hypothetical protein